MAHRFSSDEEERVFLSKVSTISVGDTRDAVVRLLGLPDEDELTMPKESWRHEVLGHELRYRLPRARGKTGQEYERWMRVSTDARGVVYEVVPHNATLAQE